VALGAQVTPLLLDTHAWVWWVTRPDRLSRAQRNAIERAQRRSAPLLVSIISCWEVALLAERAKLRFSIPTATWLEQATALPGFDVVPITLSVIGNAVRLAALRDPADQLITATALDRGARLVTSDERIADSKLVPVVA
jgi:PIN domain nuclease of toxin-antitoxin system